MNRPYSPQPSVVYRSGKAQVYGFLLSQANCTYDIWALPVMDKPSILGDSTDFTQIFNVRRVRRKCGQISLSEHFAKWDAVGLTLGKLEEAMFLMEAQNNSGTIDVKATVTLE